MIHSRYPVDDGQQAENAKEKEPKPKEDVDLLVDNVQGKYANGVVSLDFTAHAVFVEGALGHPREYVDHRIHPILLIGLEESQHLDTKVEKGTVEEAVHQKHLTCAWRFYQS